MTEGSAAPRALLLLPEILVTEAHAPAEPGRGVLVAGERIEAIGSRAELERLAPDAEVVPLPGAVLIPGLVDAHSHLRGLSTLHHGIEDAPLERWIVRLHAMGAVDPAADALIAAVDAVTTGITTAQILQHGFGDASSYLGGVVATRDALVAAGLHAEVILGLTDQAEFVPEDVAAALPPARREWLVPTRGVTPDGFAELVTAARPLLDPDPGGDPAGAGAGVGAADGAAPWIRAGVAPVGPQWASDALLEVVASLAGPGCRVHTHALETRAQRWWGPDTPLDRLERHGLLAPFCSLAHGVHLDPTELARLAQAQVAVVSCPSSNHAVSDGVGDVLGWRDAGVPVAMGLDSTGAVHPADAFAELRALQRAAAARGRTLTARDALDVATRGGAVAVGRSEHIGAIAVGARADLVAVRRPSDPGPDPIDDLVRGATREDVTDVWSAGSRVVAGGRHRAADEVHAARERVHHDLARTADERARVRRTIAELEPEVERIRLARSSPPRPQDRG